MLEQLHQLLLNQKEALRHGRFDEALSIQDDINTIFHTIKDSSYPDTYPSALSDSCVQLIEECGKLFSEERDLLKDEYYRTQFDRKIKEFLKKS